MTLPDELVRERNRSKFIRDAVQREVARRRQEELRRSLREPHPDTEQTAQLGMDEWAGQVVDDDEDLVEPAVGKAVRWEPGRGWTEILE